MLVRCWENSCELIYRKQLEQIYIYIRASNRMGQSHPISWDKIIFWNIPWDGMNFLSHGIFLSLCYRKIQLLFLSNIHSKYLLRMKDRSIYYPLIVSLFPQHQRYHFLFSCSIRLWKSFLYCSHKSKKACRLRTLVSYTLDYNVHHKLLFVLVHINHWVYREVGWAWFPIVFKNGRS